MACYQCYTDSEDMALIVELDDGQEIFSCLCGNLYVYVERSIRTNEVDWDGMALEDLEEAEEEMIVKMDDEDFVRYLRTDKGRNERPEWFACHGCDKPLQTLSMSSVDEDLCKECEKRLCSCDRCGTALLEEHLDASGLYCSPCTEEVERLSAERELSTLY